jgi:allantoinase
MSQAFRSTRVLTPEGLVPAALVVDEGRIAEACGWDVVSGSAGLHDFGDALILPGLVDTHVHINDPGRDWEGFETATRAAASGGVTTLVDMPLNCIPETTDLRSLAAKRAAARRHVWVDWAAWGGVVRGNAGALLPMARAGVPGFKCFLIDSGIDGFAWVGEADLRLAFERLRGTGLPLLAHAEVAGPVDAATQTLSQSDWHKYSTYLRSRPDTAEIEAIGLLIRLALEFSSPIHIVHLSSAKALPLLAEARRRGVPVTIETCVQYLWFAAEEIPDGATEFKCAPPIRGRANREALWDAVEDGLIDMITTDHSPCPPAMKRREEGRWDQAWGGIASLGLALPVIWTALHLRGFDSTESAERVAEWMAAAPARLAGLAGKKGALVPGADADFLILDPDARWTVTEESLHFRHKVSPYLGTELRGKARETWLSGEPVYRDGEFLGVPRGRELIHQPEQVSV